MPARTATDLGNIEPGIYRAKLKGIEDVLEGGQYGPYTKWFFEVTDEDYEGPDLRGNTSLSFGPLAKARMWAEALLGRRIRNGETVELDDLIGRECDLTIRLEETDRGTYPRIDAANAIRRNKSKHKPTEKSQEQMEQKEDFEDLPF